jgi:hypothetical protein
MRGTRDSDPEMYIAWMAPLKFIRRFKKNRAIKSYVNKLPGLLATDYGRSTHYRPSQIKRTIERAGLTPYMLVTP